MTEPNASRPAPSHIPFFHGYVVVAAAFLVMVLIYGVRFSFGIFLKPMSAEFGWSRAMTSGAFSLSWIVEGVLALAVGALNDRYGPRVTITLLGFLAGVGYILMARVGTVWQLYLFFGVIAGAGSGVFVPLTSTIARWFIGRRSLMTGMAIAGIGIGSLFGPLLANRIIDSYGWRASFIVLGATVLVIVILAAQFLRRNPAEIGQKPYIGSMSTATRDSPQDSISYRSALRSTPFWLFFGMMFCLGYAFFSLQVHLAPYATDIRLSAATAAGMLATMGAASIIGRGVLGAIGDRIGNKRAFMLGFVLIVLSLSWLTVSAGPWGLYLFAVIFGLAYGNSSTQQSPLAAQLFGLKFHGLIFGAAGIGFTIGSALGPLLTGYLFDVTGAYRTAFLVAAAVALIGLALNATLPLKQASLWQRSMKKHRRK